MGFRMSPLLDKCKESSFRFAIITDTLKERFYYYHMLVQSFSVSVCPFYLFILPLHLYILSYKNIHFLNCFLLYGIRLLSRVFIYCLVGMLLFQDRLEIILSTWIECGYVPSPAEVSEKEGINFLGVKGGMLLTLLFLFNTVQVMFFSSELIVT